MARTIATWTGNPKVVSSKFEVQTQMKTLHSYDYCDEMLRQRTPRTAGCSTGWIRYNRQFAHKSRETYGSTSISKHHADTRAKKKANVLVLVLCNPWLCLSNHGGMGKSCPKVIRNKVKWSLCIKQMTVQQYACFVFCLQLFVETSACIPLALFASMVICQTQKSTSLLVCLP